MAFVHQIKTAEVKMEPGDGVGFKSDMDQVTTSESKTECDDDTWPVTDQVSTAEIKTECNEDICPDAFQTTTSEIKREHEDGIYQDVNNTATSMAWEVVEEVRFNENRQLSGTSPSAEAKPKSTIFHGGVQNCSNLDEVDNADYFTTDVKMEPEETGGERLPPGSQCQTVVGASLAGNVKVENLNSDLCLRRGNATNNLQPTLSPEGQCKPAVRASPAGKLNKEKLDLSEQGGTIDTMYPLQPPCTSAAGVEYVDHNDSFSVGLSDDSTPFFVPCAGKEATSPALNEQEKEDDCGPVIAYVQSGNEVWAINRAQFSPAETQNSTRISQKSAVFVDTFGKISQCLAGKRQASAVFKDASGTVKRTMTIKTVENGSNLQPICHASGSQSATVGSETKFPQSSTVGQTLGAFMPLPGKPATIAVMTNSSTASSSVFQTLSASFLYPHCDCRVLGAEAQGREKSLEHVGVLWFMKKRLFTFAKDGNLFCFLMEYHAQKMLPEAEFVESFLTKIKSSHSSEMCLASPEEWQFMQEIYPKWLTTFDPSTMVTPYVMHLMFKEAAKTNRRWLPESKSLFYLVQYEHTCPWTLLVTPMADGVTLPSLGNAVDDNNRRPVPRSVHVPRILAGRKKQAMKAPDMKTENSVHQALKALIEKYSLQNLMEPFCTCEMTTSNLVDAVHRTSEGARHYQVARVSFMETRSLYCWLRPFGFFVSVQELKVLGLLPWKKHLVEDMLFAFRIDEERAYLTDLETDLLTAYATSITGEISTMLVNVKALRLVYRCLSKFDRSWKTFSRAKFYIKLRNHKCLATLVNPAVLRPNLSPDEVYFRQDHCRGKIYALQQTNPAASKSDVPSTFLPEKEVPSSSSSDVPKSVKKEDLPGVSKAKYAASNSINQSIFPKKKKAEMRLSPSSDMLKFIEEETPACSSKGKHSVKETATVSDRRSGSSRHARRFRLEEKMEIRGETTGSKMLVKRTEPFEKREDADNAFKLKDFPKACSCILDPTAFPYFSILACSATARSCKTLTLNKCLGRAVLRPEDDCTLLYTFTKNNTVYFSVAELQMKGILPLYNLDLSTVPRVGRLHWCQKADEVDLRCLKMRQINLKTTTHGDRLMSAELLCRVLNHMDVSLQQSDIFLMKMGHICTDSKSMAFVVQQKHPQPPTVAAAWAREASDMLEAGASPVLWPERRKESGGSITMAQGQTASPGSDTRNKLTLVSSGAVKLESGTTEHHRVLCEQESEQGNQAQSGQSTSCTTQIVAHGVKSVTPAHLGLQQPDEHSTEIALRVLVEHAAYILFPEFKVDYYMTQLHEQQSGATLADLITRLESCETPASEYRSAPPKDFTAEEEHAASLPMYEGKCVGRLRYVQGMAHSEPRDVSLQLIEKSLGARADDYWIVLTGLLDFNGVTLTSMYVNNSLFVNWMEFASMSQLNAEVVFQMASTLQIHVYRPPLVVRQHLMAPQKIQSCDGSWVSVKSLRAVYFLGQETGECSIYPKTFQFLHSLFVAKTPVGKFSDFVLIKKKGDSLPLGRYVFCDLSENRSNR